MRHVDIHNGPRMRYVALAALVVIPLTLLTTACDPGPECVSSHTEVRPVTGIGPKGQVSVQTVVTEVCDQYADPSPTASK